MVAAAGAVVLGVSLRHFDQQERTFVYDSAKDDGADRRLDRVGTNVHQKPLQFVHLLTRQILNIAPVSHAAKQYPAVRVAKCRDFIR